MDPANWGVARGFSDGTGAWREVDPATVDDVTRALGGGEAAAPPPEGPMFLRPGQWPDLGPGTSVLLEDGTVLEDGGLEDGGLPLGYHHAVDPATGDRRLVVVSPGQCVLPGEATWGWAVQLYATRSRRSWGMGDLGDLAHLGRIGRRLGAGVVMVNPLHAPLPGHPQEPSPYYPSSRQFLSPLYIDVAAVPGAGALGSALEEAARAGRRLNDDRLIDRDAVWRIKLPTLEAVWAATVEPGEDFEAFVRAGGEALEGFATYSTLAEVHGPTWRAWPAELRHPRSEAVAEAARRNRPRVRFHQWLQWLASTQLSAAAQTTAVVADLAVGVNPAGADAWLWQDQMCFGVSVGAPPDDFNRQGQDWGIPPFNPFLLRRGGYEPFLGLLRSGMRRGGGVRLDHVLGLFRQFWISRGRDEGTYVDFPADELLDLVALESHRAGAFVVGEDLGNVGDGVRAELAKRHVLSYRLLWFEPDHPQYWPAESLGAVTTHDLPTIAGLWTGADLEDQRAAGVEPSVEGNQAVRSHLARVLDLDPAPDPLMADSVAPDSVAPDSVTQVIRRAHSRLAEAPSVLLTASLEDALGVTERVNLPGTTSERPNWRLALPVELEDLATHPGVAELAEVMGRNGAGRAGEG